MTLGERLAILRKSNGLSQEKLAEELNLTRQTISKWELDQSTPDIDYLIKLIDYYNVSTDYLIKGEKIDDTTHPGVELTTAGGEEYVARNDPFKLFVYLGGMIMAVALAGMIVFAVCSVLHPWTVLIDNWCFEGLLGFLIGSKTLWLFIVLAVLFLLSGVAAIYGIVKSFHKK